MSLSKFLQDLRQTGRVLVPKPAGGPDAPAVGEVEAVLALDEAARAEAPGEAPELSVAAALWAAALFYESARLLVFRDLGEEHVAAAFSERCPEGPSPSVCWSVDLTLRYLNDLHLLARGIAEKDPLVVFLSRLAAEWPLSSVGMAVAEADVSAFIAHPALRQLYADRVTERADESRLSDPRVREAVRASLGGFPELAPRLARALSREAPR